MVCGWFSSFIGRIAIVGGALAGICWSAHASDDFKPQWREDRIKLRITAPAECAQFALEGLVRRTVLRIAMRSRQGSSACGCMRMQYVVRAKPSTGVASDAGDAATSPGWSASRRGQTVAQGSFMALRDVDHLDIVLPRKPSFKNPWLEVSIGCFSVSPDF